MQVAPDAEDVGDFKDASIAGKTVQEWRRVTIRGSPDAQYKVGISTFYFFECVKIIEVTCMCNLVYTQAQYCLFQSVGNDAGLSPQQLTEVKLRIDIPVPRAAIGRIIGKGGSTVSYLCSGKITCYLHTMRIFTCVYTGEGHSTRWTSSFGYPRYAASPCH